MTQADAGGWIPCPPGEFTRLAALLRFRRRLWTAAAVGGLVVAATGVAGITWTFREVVADRPTQGTCHPMAPAKDAPAGHDDLKGEKPAKTETLARGCMIRFKKSRD